MIRILRLSLIRISASSRKQKLRVLIILVLFFWLKHQYSKDSIVGDQQDTSTTDPPQPRILVAYSGPTLYTLDEEKKKPTLYRLNFEYFLEQGVQCQTQDTALVVTEQVEPYYRKRIDQLNSDCAKKYGTFVKLLIRNETCYDMESVRVVLNDPVIAANSTYDYFVYANCGVTGPAKELASNWTSLFTQKLNDRIKMTGITAECANIVHIQSMVYAVDRVGLGVIHNIPFDCREDERYMALTEPAHKVGHIVNRYERQMGVSIMRAGYGIEAFLRPKQYFKDDKCTDNDLWLTSHLNETFGGRMPRLQDTLFFKTSRVLTPEIAEEIKFTGKVDWNW